MNKEQKEKIIQELSNTLNLLHLLPGNKVSILFSKEVSQKKFGCKLSKLKGKAEENGMLISKHPKGYLVIAIDKVSIAE